WLTIVTRLPRNWAAGDVHAATGHSSLRPGFFTQLVNSRFVRHIQDWPLAFSAPTRFMRRRQNLQESPQSYQWQWQTRPSTRPSDELSESAALAEARMLRARRESGKKRECRGQTFRSDRKVVRQSIRVLAVDAHVVSHVRVDHRVVRTRLIQSDKL